jgi:hypothetical protein
MQKQKIKDFTKLVTQENLKKLDHSKAKIHSETLETRFEKKIKGKLNVLKQEAIQEICSDKKEVVEHLEGLEISLAGRIKGAAMARRTTTGLAGSLKPQTILGSQTYSVYQKNVYTK